MWAATKTANPASAIARHKEAARVRTTLLLSRRQLAMSGTDVVTQKA